MFSSLVSRMIDQLILGEFGQGKVSESQKEKKEQKKQQNHVVCK